MATRKTMPDGTTRLPGGLLIPERCTLAKLAVNTATSTTSGYSEATPRPGFPVPGDANSRLRLEVSGSQGVDIDVQCIKAGNPSRDGLQLAFKKDSEASTEWLGWNGFQLLSDWIPVDWANTSERADIATIPSTQKVVVAYREAATSQARASVIGTDLSETPSAGTMADGSDWNYPALVVLPGSERLLCAYGGAMYYSDDLGVNWATYSEFITTQSTATYGRTKIVEYRGDMLMIVNDSGTADKVYHLTSTDLGASFQLVAATTSWGDNVDIVANQDGCHVLYLSADATPKVQYLKMGNVFESLGGTPATIDTGAEFVSASICADGSGGLFVLAGDDQGWIYESLDSGGTWSGAYTTSSYDLTVTADTLAHCRATYALGQMMVLHAYKDNGSLVTTKSAVAVLGGWSNVVVGISGAPAPFPKNRWGYGLNDQTFSTGVGGGTYLPWALPDGMGWTKTGTGTPALHSTGTLQISTSAANAYYDITPPGDPTSLLVKAQVVVISGGSAVARAITLAVRLADASSYEYEFEVLFRGAGFIVDDSNSAATANVTLDMTVTRQLKFLMDKGTVDIHYRTPGTTSWTTVGTLALTDAGATANADLIRWGHETNSTSESRWTQVHWCSAQTFGPDAVTGVANIYGKTFNSRPEPIPNVGSGTVVARLAAVAGPARRADAQDVDAWYDHAIDNVHAEVEPSPKVKWRSTDLSEQTFVYDLGAEGWAGNGVALYVDGANFKTCYVESYNGSSWDIVETLVLSDGFTGLRYTLTGDMLYPDVANTNPGGRWLWEQELRGAWIQCTGTTGPVTASTRILSQSAGGWLPSSTGTTLLPIIELDDTSAISALAGTLTCNLVSSCGFIVAYHTTQAASLKRYWRVRIPAGTAGESTPIGEAYYEAGIISICRVQPFGAEVEWGHADNSALNVNRSRDNRGTLRVRERGDPARTWSLGWPNGEHRRQLRVDGPDVDYHGPTNQLPLAGAEDISEALRGYLQVVASGETPVIAVEPLPTDSGTIVTDRTRFVYGRLVSGVEARRFGGDDLGTDENIRPGTIRIEEIV